MLMSLPDGQLIDIGCVNICMKPNGEYDDVYTCIGKLGDGREFACTTDDLSPVQDSYPFNRIAMLERQAD